MAKASTIARGARRHDASQARKSGPSISSIAMNTSPAASPTSNTVTRFGWLTAAAARASRAKRRRSSPPAAGARSSLSATLRRKTGSNAA